MPTKQPYVKLTLGRDGRWRFSRVNTNGRKTQSSQGYAYKRSAVKAARRDVPGVEIRG